MSLLKWPKRNAPLPEPIPATEESFDDFLAKAAEDRTTVEERDLLSRLDAVAFSGTRDGPMQAYRLLRNITTDLIQYGHRVRRANDYFKDKLLRISESKPL